MVVKRLLVPGQKYRLRLESPYQRGMHEAILVYVGSEGDDFVFSLITNGEPIAIPREYVESWEHVPYSTLSRRSRQVREREKVEQ